jgi:hypothetical protein
VSILKYGLSWPDSAEPIQIELSLIRKGDAWLKQRGDSLVFHHREAQTLVWPKDDHHRWSDLILQTYCEEEISVILGCSDSGKTYGMAKIILLDYWADPDNTLWLVSTTEGRGSELRIWGVIKDLFNAARERFDFLDGNPIDHLKTITTEEIDEDKREARSLRRGIIVIPCKSGGLTSGLAPYIGIKSPRLRHAGDEVAVMNEGFLNAYSNWFGKEDFKGIMAGNFMETDDPLGIASEPVEGWDSWVDTGKTQTWRTRFYNAQAIALDGRDSPNNDFPVAPGHRQKFPYLIGPKKLSGVAATSGTDSWQWFSQCVGKPAKGMDVWRVLTRDFCRLHHATEEIVWLGDPLTDLYSLDPAYGGGDLCVGRHLQMGLDLEKKQILLLHPPEIIPIKVNAEKDAEAQIAAFIHSRLRELNVPAKNCGYDSFGRGTLGFEFAKLFGNDCPVPIDSGMMPTARPVRFDLFVEDREGKRRLKRCDEHYRKFITEMWFSIYEAIGSEQVRGLDAETLREGCSRKFRKNDDGRIELETKDDYKERHRGRSPDRCDNLAIGLEIARRRGFIIMRLGKGIDAKQADKPTSLDKWLEEKSAWEKTQELQLV